MPTNFTVVPVKDSAGKAAEGSENDVDDSNVLKEEDEEATGESGTFYLSSSAGRE